MLLISSPLLGLQPNNIFTTAIILLFLYKLYIHNVSDTLIVQLSKKPQNNNHSIIYLYTFEGVFQLNILYILCLATYLKEM